MAGEQAVAQTQDADVIVVGAGPGGSTAGHYLAQAGLDVLVLEKSSFPRDKVCGDGLTPRSVKSLIDLGVDTSTEAGWIRNKGLRVIAGGHRLEMPWPELSSWPDYGLVRPRADLDSLIAARAVQSGARLQERTTVVAAELDQAGRVCGVQARTGPGKEPATYRAPIVLAADGVSGRLAVSLGINKREDRPMGVAVRQYYTSPRTNDDHLESWLELWDGTGADRRLMPGYGWIFGVGDGTSNVGLGILNSSAAFQSVDYRALLQSWLRGLPEEWGFTPSNAVGPVRGGGLPMGFNRTPHYSRGMLLVGDAGGAVNPFNGEGIAYAMETAKIAAERVADALGRPEGPAREAALQGYVRSLKDGYGGYYRLGKIFVALIGNPRVMQLATQRGLSHPTLMRFVLKLLANLTDPHGGDAMDRVINGLTRLAPAV
ncbi:MAG: geranylgeranyl reductase family protein [Geodermatophilaceae bacterium]|nr:geranylgeranyl reductase family protein [Geodermatophilaceae bacterium]